MRCESVRTPLACFHQLRSSEARRRRTYRSLELHPAQESSGKPLVRPKTLESRIYFEIDHPVSAILKSFVQPDEGLVLVLQSDIDGRDVIGRNILLFWRLQQIVQVEPGALLVSPARASALAYSAFISGESPDALIAFSNSAMASRCIPICE